MLGGFFCDLIFQNFGKKRPKTAGSAALEKVHAFSIDFAQM